MNEITWSYLQNPFDNVTKHSFKKMNILATDHHDKLANHLNDNFIADLYHQHFLDAYTKFKDAYAASIANVASYRGRTQMIEKLIAQLSNEKIKQWDIWIQNVYLEGTPEYSILMNQGRKPYQSGSYEARIMAVKVLSNLLKDFPLLNNVLTDVNNFYDTILKARSLQQGKENDEQILSMQLEEARKELAKAMQVVFAGLMFHYHQNIAFVETFYELKYLRATPSNSNANNEKTESIPANSRISLHENELSGEKAVEITNVGTVPVKVYTSETMNGAIPENAKTIESNETSLHFPEDLSDGTGINKLVVVNENEQEAKIKTKLNTLSEGG